MADWPNRLATGVRVRQCRAGGSASARATCLDTLFPLTDDTVGPGRGSNVRSNVPWTGLRELFSLAPSLRADASVRVVREWVCSKEVVHGFTKTCPGLRSYRRSGRPSGDRRGGSGRGRLRQQQGQRPAVPGDGVDELQQPFGLRQLSRRLLGLGRLQSGRNLRW